MNSINIVIFDGNLARDPELTNLASGTSLCKICVAINSSYKEKKEVAYINVDAWGKIGESCNSYLKKGSRVTVTGRLKQNTWKDQDGKSRSEIRVVADSVRFDSKPSQNHDLTPPPDLGSQDEDIPF